MRWHQDWCFHSNGTPVVTELLTSDSGCQLDACLRDMVKLQRAHGGCLGDERRRRTWTAAKSSGESLTDFDPEISESGKRAAMSC